MEAGLLDPWMLWVRSQSKCYVGKGKEERGFSVLFHQLETIRNSLQHLIVPLGRGGAYLKFSSAQGKDLAQGFYLSLLVQFLGTKTLMSRNSKDQNAAMGQVWGSKAGS